MSFVLKEIHEQPEVIARLVANETANAASIAAEIKRRDVRFVTFAARGTSDHAAIYGKYLLEIGNGYPVGLADPSAFTLYSASLRMKNCLAVGISQSGEAPDVAEYLSESRAGGAITLAITNHEGSLITQSADHTMLFNAGEEKGVAATKTYTSTLAALYLLSASISGSGGADDLLRCAEQMHRVLDLEKPIADKAERYRYMDDGFVISRGWNYCTALETALKLAETSYLGMKAYSAADFLHGPIAAVSTGEPCFLFAAPGKAMPMMIDVAARLRSRGAETIVIGSSDEILTAAVTSFRMPVEVEERLSPLLYIVPGQLFAYYLAVSRGNDPDKPRGLTKVTLTR